MKKAVFLDRDGTINEDRHYVHTPENFVFLPGVPEAICLIRQKCYLVIVATNQSGVARGYFPESDVIKLHEYMQSELKKLGACADSIYYCPHLPDASIKDYAKVCRCRKPGPEMFECGLSEFDVDPVQSYAVGDKLRDLEPGKILGMKTALISQKKCLSRIADAIYPSLYDFAVSI